MERGSVDAERMNPAWRRSTALVVGVKSRILFDFITERIRQKQVTSQFQTRGGILIVTVEQLTAGMKNAQGLKPQVIAVQFPFRRQQKQNSVQLPVEKIRNEGALQRSEDGV